MLLQVTQDVIKRLVVSEGYVAAIEIGGERVLGEYDISDKRGAHV